MHGGAKGNGAPKGNQNRFRHGLYTADALWEHRLVRQLLRDSHLTIERLRD